MSLLPQDIIPIPSPFKPLQTKSNIHTKHGGSSLHKQNSTTHLSTPSQATDEDAPVAVKQSDDTAPPPSFINGDEPVTGMEPVFRRCTTRVERRRDREEKETGWRVFLDGDSTAVHGGDSVTLYRRVVLVRFISPSFLLILSFGFWSSSVNKSAGTINTSQPDKLSRPSSQLVKANQPGQLIRFGSTRSNRVDSFNTQSTQFRLGSVHVSYVWVHVGSDSVSGLSQNMSAKVNRSKKVNTVNTRSTVGSKTVNPRPECHRCTLANSCSWNDTTESR
ncbi:hypothetical protein HanXRQr2_Chr03g0119581 [Helianthus annuus]|uniref:Uncharacterized protein n=1 Tax=Helianthus annuus TaxID=4232 RepID=A0A9K3JHI6_HELAN|nr:hypothetical protein HanXRQr2_Chr03g0119581 [Helianthus annuus]KAJ0944377.1 hypothetical protein HanPSC8_Chr03g0116091 [Helianthus annuus]